jgi:hypothetical protein
MDPHSFGRSGSGSVLRMRIWIQKHGNGPKLINLTGFMSSQKGFCTFGGMFFYLLPIFLPIFLLDVMDVDPGGPKNVRRWIRFWNSAIFSTCKAAHQADYGP